MRRGGTIGASWDTRLLRRVREYGWFRQHEAELIEDARRRREEKRRGAYAASAARAAEEDVDAVKTAVVRERDSVGAIGETPSVEADLRDALGRAARILDRDLVSGGVVSERRLEVGPRSGDAGIDS